MNMEQRKHILRWLLAPFLAPAVLSTLLCRPEGPVVPKPTSLAESAIFRKAAAKLSQDFDEALSGTINAGWPVSNVSFSVGVVSLDQEDPGVPVYEYHHLARANTRGTKRLNKDSQYLIGSISKVISDYILLTSKFDLDRPITDLLPELTSNTSGIAWKDVSPRMLGSQLSGAPVNYGFSEYYYLKDAFLANGFPTIPTSEYPPCGVAALNEGCTAREFLEGMLEAYPTVAPAEQPAYSSVAFDIFIMALERVIGKTFGEMVREMVSEPLAMENTFPSPGNDNKAVIPYGDSSWGGDYDYQAPGGGLVSSLADLSRFSHALLSRTMGLTPSQIRQWLKPTAFAGSPYSAVGTPWEIFRPLNLTPDHPHAVTIYGKSGGAQLYRSQLAVLDEYGVAIVVLTAGPMQALPIIYDAVIGTVVPAVDKVARSQAQHEYSQTFEPGCLGTNASMVRAVVAQDRDSLLLQYLHRDGENVVSGMLDIWNMTMGAYAAPVGQTLRMFPSELTEPREMNGQTLTAEVWHLWPELLGRGPSDLPRSGVMAMDCLTWTIGDWVHYGSEPLDRVIFYRDSNGEVMGFELPFLRTGILQPMPRR